MNDDILESLKRIEQSLSVLVRAQLGPILQKELADKRMAELWDLTGRATQRQVKTSLNMSAITFGAEFIPRLS